MKEDPLVRFVFPIPFPLFFFFSFLLQRISNFAIYHFTYMFVVCTEEGIGVGIL